MGFTFILNAKGLRGDEIRINNGDLVRMTHGIVNVALMPQRHLRVIGILHGLLIATQLLKHEFTTIFPCGCGVEYGG